MLPAFESVFVLFAKPIIYTRALKGRKAPLLWHMCHPLSLRLYPLCSYLLQSNVFLIGREKKSVKLPDNTALSNFLSPVGVSFSQSDGLGFD